MYGCALATKNGKAFEASGMAFFYEDQPTEYFAIRYDTFTSEGFWRESVTISEIKLEIGTYPIVGEVVDLNDGFVGASYTTLTSDGDVLENVYKLVASEENMIIIESIDTVANITKGRFHLEFTIDESYSSKSPQNPEHVIFSEGSFDVTFRQ